MAAHAHLRIDAASSLFRQRVTGDFLVTLRCDEVEFGLLRAGAMFSWLAREVGGGWRLETTARREDLPRTVTISAVAAGVRIGAMACRGCRRPNQSRSFPPSIAWRLDRGRQRNPAGRAAALAVRMKTVLRALALATLVLSSTSASAKSQTIRLEISGLGLARPLEITDRRILRSFNFWNGPGVAVNGQPVHLAPDSLERIGAFIDWPRGQLQNAPSDLQPFEVIFHQRATGKHARYVIRYAYDPAQAGGYVYLPGKNDGDVYRANVFSIYHGVEGHWFHSSPAWERIVRPLIERAIDGARVTSPVAASR